MNSNFSVVWESSQPHFLCANGSNCCTHFSSIFWFDEYWLASMKPTIYNIIIYNQMFTTTWLPIIVDNSCFLFYLVKYCKADHCKVLVAHNIHNSNNSCFLKSVLWLNMMIHTISYRSIIDRHQSWHQTGIQLLSCSEEYFVASSVMAFH